MSIIGCLGEVWRVKYSELKTCGVERTAGNGRVFQVEGRKEGWELTERLKSVFCVALRLMSAWVFLCICIFQPYVGSGSLGGGLNR